MGYARESGGVDVQVFGAGGGVDDCFELLWRLSLLIVVVFGGVAASYFRCDGEMEAECEYVLE